eukprot:COSAG04_NODE_1980_length_5091_cov_5.303085_6_plen_300_part_00
MDIGGLTALELAQGTGHPEIAALLKQADEANTVAVEPQNRSWRQEAEDWMSKELLSSCQGQCVDRGNAEQRDKTEVVATLPVRRAKNTIISRPPPHENQPSTPPPASLGAPSSPRSSSANELPWTTTHASASSLAKQQRTCRGLARGVDCVTDRTWAASTETSATASLIPAPSCAQTPKHVQDRKPTVGHSRPRPRSRSRSAHPPKHDQDKSRRLETQDREEDCVGCAVTGGPSGVSSPPPWCGIVSALLVSPRNGESTSPPNCACASSAADMEPIMPAATSSAQTAQPNGACWSLSCC